MNPAIKRLRLKSTKTGEMRVAYSRTEAIAMIGLPFLPSLLKRMEESRVIPSSIFLWPTPYYTLKQITLLKEWASGKLPRHIDLRTYLYAHWHETDEEETKER
jgi:hypothetical protein